MALQPLPGLGLPHKTPPVIPIFSSSPPTFSPAVVMHPSGPHPSIWFLVFPLDLWCRGYFLHLVILIVWHGAPIMKQIIIQLFPLFCLVLPLRYKYSLLRTALKNPPHKFLPLAKDQVSGP